MKRKTFVREAGWSAFLALACTVVLTGLQVYLEVIGDESANVWTWIIDAIMIIAVTLLMVVIYRSVRRHNAKVDAELRRQRDNWKKAVATDMWSHALVHDDLGGAGHDPGPSWHR